MNTSQKGIKFESYIILADNNSMSTGDSEYVEPRNKLSIDLRRSVFMTLLKRISSPFILKKSELIQLVQETFFSHPEDKMLTSHSEPIYVRTTQLSISFFFELKLIYNMQFQVYNIRIQYFYTDLLFLNPQNAYTREGIQEGIWIYSHSYSFPSLHPLHLSHCAK